MKDLQGLSPEARRELLETLLRKDAARKQRNSAAAAITRIARDQPLPVSFAQERFWFLEQLTPGTALYNIPIAMRLRGRLDRDALAAAWLDVVERHEVLRAVFPAREGRPAQVLRPAKDFALVFEALDEAQLGERVRENATRPFDLAAGPLVRAALIPISDEDHALLLGMHHIVGDGWSFELLFRELSAAYSARAKGNAPALPEQPLQFCDYAAWQRAFLSDAGYESQLDYWRARLGGAQTALELPTDRRRPAVQGFKGLVTERVRIPDALYRDAQAFARTEGLSLFVLLESVFQILLYRYSGQTDLSVGTPVAGRTRKELESIVGPCLNTLVLRTDLGGAPSFRQALSRVRETVVGALSNQDIPFERLVEVLRPSRDRSRTPFFQVIFDLQQAPAGLKWEGLDVTPLGAQTGTAKVELTWNLWEEGEGLFLWAEYDTALFERETIERMQRHYVQLLRSALADPERSIDRLALHDEAERRWLIEGVNPRMAAAPAQHECLHHRFERRVDANPEAVAVSCEGRALTYAELDRRANQLAHELIALGVRPDDRVGLLLERGPELVVAVLGILKAGGAYVPFDPAYPAERIAFMADDAGIRALVSEARFSVQCDAPVVQLDAIARRPTERPRVHVKPGNLAYVIYTSGSTGQPKGVLIEHRQVGRLLDATEVWFHFNERDVWTLFHSIAFDFSVWELWGALAYGGRLVVVPYLVSRSPEAFLELLATEKVTVLNQTPSAFRQLVATDQLSVLPVPLALRYVIFGGEALELEALRPWFDRRGDQTPSLINMYGITETCVHVTYRPIRRLDLDAGCGSVIGVPIPDLQTYVLDAQLEPSPVGVVGELYVGGAGLARGYLNRPELSAQRFIANPFAPGERLYRSGDLARRLGSGELEYLGRIDHQVKLRGFRIELGEIEAVLARHPEVAQVAVIAREDVAGDKRLVAYVVGRGEVSGAVLVEHARAALPEYMVPSAVVTLPALPLTTNGKLDRARLPAPESAANPTAAYEAPVGEVEQTLATIWAEVLRVERVGRHDNFFDLGGHSLLATQAVARARAALKAELPVRAIFEAPSVAELAQYLAPAATSNAEFARVDRSRPVPLSFAQERLWFLERLEPDSPFYNLTVAVRLNGALEVAALRSALDAIYARHEALRTVFVEVGGRPVQRFLPAAPLPLPQEDLSADPERLLRARIEQAERSRIDLRTGPLMQPRLFRLGERAHALVVCFHHIAVDEWSIEVFFRELAAHYAAAVEGRSADVPPLPVQFADFAAHQRTTLSGEALERQLEWWREQLAGTPPLLELPADHPRPTALSYRGGRRGIVLPPELAAQVKALGHELGATPFMTFLAVFQLLLARYTGRDDVPVGTAVSNRGRPELDALIGFFVNTVVIRSRLDGNPTFRELLARVKETALGAYAHGEVPFELVVNALQPERTLSHHPLFQANFVLAGGSEHVTLPGLSLEPLDIGGTTSKFDLTLYLEDRLDGLAATFEYASDLFEAATIDRMLGHLRRLLEGIAGAPSTPIRELQLLTAGEREELLTTFNPRAAFEGPQLCHALFEAQADATPDAAAVIWNGQPYSYADVEARANALAHHLIALGVRPDGRVAICIERSVEMVVAVLGAFKAGAGYVPLDPTYPAERLQYMCETARVDLVLTQQSLRHLVEQSAPRVVSLDTEWAEVQRQPTSRPWVDCHPEQLAYVIFTSGSTGRPKGIAMPHAPLWNLIRWQLRNSELAPGARTLQFSAFSFDASFQEMFSTWAAGGALVLISDAQRKDPAELARFIADQHVERLYVPFVALQQLAESGRLPTGLREVNTSGEQLRVTPQLISMFERLGTCTLYNMYGPSENHVITSERLDADPRKWAALPPIGSAISNSRVYVLDPQLQPVPIGVPGEIYIGGVAVARGYVGRPDLSAERFIPDPHGGEGARMYRSGDLGRMLPNGSIEFLGRIDHQVKIRGFRVELGEIEAALAEHPDVRDGVVVARDDRGGLKKLVAYVVWSTAPADPHHEVRRFLSERLPEYMLPSAVVTLPAFPLTPSGKVDRRALPEPQEIADTPARFVAPRTPEEQVLAAIWAEVLGVPRVGITDDFFDVGGHSLLATQVMSRIRAALGVDLPLRVLFERPTIEQLAEALTSATRDDEAPIAPAPLSPSRTAPLSFTQQRFWFLHQFLPGVPVYNVPMALRLEGALDAAALDRAITALVERHEILRTTFEHRDGQPVQVIHPAPNAVLTQVDLTAVPREELDLAVRQTLEAEARRSFDLQKGPLFRAELLHLGEDEHVLLITMHHIVTDGWSHDVMYQELEALYGAFVTGAPSPLQPMALQFRDYAAWQHQTLSGERLAKEIAWWRERLAGAPVALELPTDRPRPAVQSFRGAGTRELQLPDEVFRGLTEATRRYGVTSFMLLEAAFHVLLYWYSGQKDILVGTAVAGRRRKEMEALIGPFINNLVLRVDLSGSPRFSEVLARVREAALGAFAHQDVPFEKLVDELNPPRDLSRSPFFQVLFNHQRIGRSGLSLAGLKVRPLHPESVAAKYDLLLHLTESDDALRAGFEYNADLFDASTIERMLENLQVLLTAIAKDPEQSIDALEVLAPAERGDVIGRWNDTRAGFPDVCLHRLFEAQAARTPEAVALEFGDSQLSYRELDQRANALAHLLRARGVGPEVRVGLCVERSFDLVIGALAVLKAGGAYVPVDPRYPKDRIGYMLENTRAALLLTQASVRDRLPDVLPPVIELDEAMAPVAAPPEDLGATDNLAYIIHTSGSTGRPKGVMVRHRPPANLIHWINTQYEVGPGDRLLFVTSPCFDLSVYDMFGALAAGATVYVASEEELAAPESLTALLRERAITVWDSAPAALVQLVPFFGSGSTSLRLVMLSGDWIPLSLPPAVWATFPNAKVKALGGATEATIWSNHFPVEHIEPWWRSVPYGRPMSNARYYVLTEHLQPAPVGVPGDLYIGGECLADGYVSDPAQTAWRFIPDPYSPTPGGRMYRTGDRARFFADGNLEFLGRLDHQVKIRGFRIELGEIEAVLRRHPNVREAVVLAREDVPGDKRLVAYLVSADGAVIPPAALRELLAQSLPDYMTPSAFVAIPGLPVTSNGKLDRKALPAPDHAAADDRPFLPPTAPDEVRLAGLWSALLGVARVGLGDNFFELGGHSLLAAQLVGRIRDELGAELRLTDIFTAATLGELVETVRAARPKAELGGLVTLREGSRTPLVVVHTWTGDGAEYGQLAAHLAPDQPVLALTAPELASGQSFASIEARAAAYVATLRAARRGPWRIAGYSSAGFIALELARQLREAGEEVEALVILDTATALLDPATPKPALQADPRRFFMVLKGDEAVAEYDALGTDEEKTALVRRELVANAFLPPDASDVQLHGALRTLQETSRAQREYRVATYDGRTIVISTTDTQSWARTKDPTVGWSAMARVTSHVVFDCTHRELVRHPNARAVAEFLQSQLDANEVAA